MKVHGSTAPSLTELSGKELPSTSLFSKSISFTSYGKRSTMIPQTASTMDPEPNPLRTLTVLLNYERTTSDWRLVNTRLLNTSFVDPNAWSTITPKEHKRYLPNKPTTLQEENIHIFHPYTEPENSKPLATCLIHPLASPEVQNPSPKTRDLIYNISRGNNGCYFAIYIYDHFFELCPKGQKISI